MKTHHSNQMSQTRLCTKAPIQPPTLFLKLKALSFPQLSLFPCCLLLFLLPIFPSLFLHQPWQLHNLSQSDLFRPSVLAEFIGGRKRMRTCHSASPDLLTPSPSFTQIHTMADMHVYPPPFCYLHLQYLYEHTHENILQCWWISNHSLSSRYNTTSFECLDLCPSTHCLLTKVTVLCVRAFNEVVAIKTYRWHPAVCYTLDCHCLQHAMQQKQVLQSKECL